MIVDCHTHIDFSEDGNGISEFLEASGAVDKCIVLARPGKAEEVNDRLSECVKEHKLKITGFAFVDPTAQPITKKELSSITRKKDLSGVVVYCSACKFHPADSRAMLLYEAAETLNLPVFFHNGPVLASDATLEYAQPILIDEIARTFKELKIIIGDMGAPFVEQTLAIISKHPFVYADLTIRQDCIWQVYNMVVSAYENKVMDKLLFGSGFPLGRAQKSIEILLGFNKMLIGANLPSVPRAEIHDFLEKDALAALGIKEPNSK